MSTRETVLQAFRTWVKAFGDPGGPLTDLQVKAPNFDGPRPALPYMTVFLSLHGGVLHHDEAIHTVVMGDPFVRFQGERFGTAQLHVYGDAGEAWLEDLTYSLKNEEQQRIIGALGLTVLAPLAPARALPQMRNANLERHFVQEFPYTYRAVSATIATIPLEEAVVTGDLYTTDPASDTVAISVSIDLT